LDGSRSSLRHIRGHRMACIAEKHDAAFAPTRKRLPLEDGPLVTIGAGLEHRAHVGMEASISFAQLYHLALGRPGFARQPLGRLRDTGDEVDLAANVISVVDNDVAIDTPPFGARRPNAP